MTCRSARARGVLAVVEVVVHDKAREVVDGEPATYTLAGEWGISRAFSHV